MNKWFTDANLLAKKLEPSQQALAIAMTLGTGLYPRDLLLRQMSGGIYDLFTGDGVHYQPRSFFRETVMFQGVILEKTAPQTLPIAALTTLSWPLPVIDTLGFWNVAAPTRITIQEGIEVVEFSAGWGSVASIGNIVTVIVIMKDGVVVKVSGATISGNQANVVVSGPWKVEDGDFFEAAIFVSKASQTTGTAQTFFSMNVLQAK